MGKFIFDQLAFVRQALLRTVKDISESQADLVPEGFNNNVRWNLGHVYLVQERFAFQFDNQPVEIPEGYGKLFLSGTKPSEWEIKPPTMEELVEALREQPNRIRARLQDRFDQTVENPFNRIPGLSLSTFDELLTFSLYHEGGHTETIKAILKLTNR